MKIWLRIFIIMNIFKLYPWSSCLFDSRMRLRTLHLKESSMCYWCRLSKNYNLILLLLIPKDSSYYFILLMNIFYHPLKFYVTLNVMNDVVPEIQKENPICEVDLFVLFLNWLFSDLKVHYHHSPTSFYFQSQIFLSRMHNTGSYTILV